MGTDSLHAIIKRDKQIWKFCFYGFFKNLRFFEPYLYIFFLSLGFSFFEIGLLFAIREVVVYILEVPTGVFADNYGKKKSLYLSFISYINSFILFFFSKNFTLAALGMVLYGMGETFRSGSHKALIYAYLEKKGWFSEKTFVYGRTRSFSLLGSAISSVLAIAFVLNIPAIRWIFIITILPYIFDLLLIMSYPDDIDYKFFRGFSFKEFISSIFLKLRSIFKNKYVFKVLLSSSIYDGIFKTIKDYIQPVLKHMIIAGEVVIISSLNVESNVKIVLGMVYGMFYIAGSSVSRNVYRLLKYASSAKLMNLFFDYMGLVFIAMFFIIRTKWILLVVILYFILYLMKNARRPLVVDVLGDIMKKEERTTVLSLDSELRAVFMAVFAPLFGFLADKLGVSTAFLFAGVFVLIANRIIYVSKTLE